MSEFTLTTSALGTRNLVIAATFTAEPVAPALDAWLLESAVTLKPAFAPFDQVHQQLLDPAGMFARNVGGVNVALVRFQDGLRGGGEEGVEERLRSLENALRNYDFLPPLVVVRCPDSLDREASCADRERRVLAACEPERGVFGVPAADLFALCPSSTYDSAHGEQIGRVPYTEGFYTTLAAVLARRVAALQPSPYKAIAIDCDGTLWEGACAEEGAEGVGLSPVFLEVQEFLIAQAARGMALCLCSKNEPADVWGVFRRRPEMPLKETHIAAVRIGWGRKSDALRDLAAELNIASEAFVFLDDNPAERAEMQAHAPEVLTLAVPSESDARPAFLEATWAFDRLLTTEADRRRGGFYREEGHRRRAREAAPSFQAFLDGLELEVDVEPAAEVDFVRVEQLMQRTNQFNTTGLRCSLGELRSWTCGAGRGVHVIRARDRFSDYGLVGATLSERREGTLHVPALMLSCRALGRGVEHRLLNALGARAEALGVKAVELAFIPLERNTPARVFLESVGCTRTADAFVIAAGEAKTARLTSNPTDRSAAQQPPVSAATALQSGTARVRIDRTEEARRLARLATLWDHPLRVVDEGLARAPRPSALEPAEPLRTETERTIAGFWADVLRLHEVGRNDDFFELGGDSILGTMVLGRIYDAFQVELTLPALFETPTVAGLAHTISLHEVSHIDADELARELEALQGLSEAEVRALLAAE